MGRMRDEDLDRLFEELPSAEASPDFTRQVLARLDERAALRPGPGHPKRLLALAAATLAAALLSSYLAAWYERSRTAERIESLRSEYRELREELDKVRALADQLEPVWRLGGTDDVEFVFDLRELAASGPETPAARSDRDAEDGPRAEPASHHPDP